MFQMQLYIILVLLLSSGAMSAGLEKALRIAQFIADIYQQFPHSCIFIINPAAQQQGEDWFCIIYSSCVDLWRDIYWQKAGVQVLLICDIAVVLAECVMKGKVNWWLFFFHFELNGNAQNSTFNNKFYS